MQNQIIFDKDIEFRDKEQWITFAGIDSSVDNVYYLARKKVNISECLQNAVVHICAHSCYIFYLNGRLIGQGPAKGSVYTCYYDSYDISRDLQPGDNCFALEIHHPGSHFRTCLPGTPAFWCQLPAMKNWRNDDWQVCPDPSRLPGAPEFTFQMGYTNLRDMRNTPVGWQCFEDDSPAWAAGTVVKNPDNVNLMARDIPPMTGELILPAELTGCGTVPVIPPDIQTQDFAAISSEESQTADNSVFDQLSGRIEAFPDGRGVYLLYDFKREVYGNVIIKAKAPAGTILDITYGEILEDGRVNAFYPFKDWIPKAKTKADAYRFADRHILAEGKNDIQIRLQKRGCRYVQIVFRNHTSPVFINEFGIENRVYPMKTDGFFISDKPYFNQLWKMCRHTVQHCIDDSFIDCPWREQAFWINDFLVANLYYFNLTADSRLPRHCFDLAVDGFKYYGFMPAVYPAGDPLFFPSMPALWTLTFYEYWLYSGDEKGRRELLPAMDSILAAYEQYALSDGLIPNHESWWNFIDIGYADSGIEFKGCTAILNAIVAAAYKRAAELHDKKECVDKYLRRAAEICTGMKNALWDKRNRRFRDSTQSGYGFETFSVHPHAILLLFNLMPECNSMFADALTSPEAIDAEPYFQRFVLEAKAKIGRHDLAEKCIEGLWKKMVESDSPTVWEIAAKGPKAKGTAQSLCHAFSCAPIAYFTRIIAGITPVEPGFSKFLVNPISNSVKNFDCSQPTPHGTIRIKRNENELDLFIPSGTTAILPDGSELKEGVHNYRI